jgi:hypothetical protein
VGEMMLLLVSTGLGESQLITEPRTKPAPYSPMVLVEIVAPRIPIDPGRKADTASSPTPNRNLPKSPAAAGTVVIIRVVS